MAKASREESARRMFEQLVALRIAHPLPSSGSSYPADLEWKHFLDDAIRKCRVAAAAWDASVPG